MCIFKEIEIKKKLNMTCTVCVNASSYPLWYLCGVSVLFISQKINNYILINITASIFVHHLCELALKNGGFAGVF